MKGVTKIFVNGLMVVLPVAITISVLLWAGTKAENLMRLAVEPVFGGYFPGLGILVGLAVVFCMGILVNAWLIRGVVAWGENLLARMPLVKTVYQPMRDLMQFFAGSDEPQMSQVVAVQFGSEEMRLIGFVTRNDLSKLPDDLAPDDAVAVYLPMSYQLGGFTALVPRSAVQPVDMGMEEAMRFVLTAGVGKRTESTAESPERLDPVG